MLFRAHSINNALQIGTFISTLVRTAVIQQSHNCGVARSKKPFCINHHSSNSVGSNRLLAQCAVLETVNCATVKPICRTRLWNRPLKLELLFSLNTMHCSCSVHGQPIFYLFFVFAAMNWDMFFFCFQYDPPLLTRYLCSDILLLTMDHVGLSS